MLKVINYTLTQFILHPQSLSYDHIVGKKSGGLGNIENCQLTHPYCNSIKN